MKGEIPELPQEKRHRFEAEFGIKDKKILEIFIENKKFGEYFEKVATEILDWMNCEKIGENKYFDLIKLSCNYLTSDLIGLAKGEITDFSNKISPENFAEFTILVFKGDINSKIAKIVLKDMYDWGLILLMLLKVKDLSKLIMKKKLRDCKEVLVVMTAL